MANERDEKYRAPALDKGLDILELLARSATGLTQAEICKGLDRSPNEIYRMLETLRRRRYVTRSEEGDRYVMSLRLLVLANIHPPRRRLLDIAEPVMRKFTRSAEQSIHLAMWEDSHITIATAFSAPGNWRLSIRPGAVIGLYNTGSGQVLAAFSDAASRQAMIDGHELVPGEARQEPKKFMAQLDKIRAAGYLVTPSQTVVGAVNLAAPVLDPEGNAVAALTCPYLKRIDVYRAPDIEDVTEILLRSAAMIASRVFGTEAY